MTDSAHTSATEKQADTVSTHISMLVLTGDRVYKFRKPVVTDFCDFSTMEARLHDCEREVALNRRLTDDIYLGVAQLRLDGEDGDDSEAEPCVVMRRLPQGRLLSTLIESGADISAAVRDIAAQLVSFHANAERSPRIDAGSTPEVIAARWENAVAQLRPFALTPNDVARLDEIDRLATRWCTGSASLFRERITTGMVCDGHADLRADNIFWLDDGVRIMDCIEFDDSLRYIDVVTDLAFLVMDLRRLGRHAEAEVLITAYEQHSRRLVPRNLLDHDVAYWALVRAKVAHLRAEQTDPAEVAASDVAARPRATPHEVDTLLTLALDHLRAARVRLMVVGGLPGTGKSTLARALGAATGWLVLATDHIRKELADLDTTARSHDEFDTGLYDPAHTAATYAELLRRARHALERGSSVIVDASWNRADDRVAAAALAEEVSADLHELRCIVGDDIARSRLQARVKADDDASDADVEVALRMAAAADEWPTATPVDTAGPVDTTVSEVCSRLGATPGSNPISS